MLLLTSIKTSGLVAFYYTFSAGLTFYNKWALTVSEPEWNICIETQSYLREI